MSSPVEILVVEDSPTQAMQLRTLLEREGYTVRIATNGEEALDSVRTHPPTVVLADVLLPILDGFEVCRLIKADPSLKEIPVILLTMLSDPKDIIRGMQCGADNFLVKPCDEKKLLAGIRYVLANRELRNHPASRIGMEVLFAGEKHVISADRVQMLDLLLASYEAAAENAEKLRKAREAAERANREKSELLARLGQEFRAPLNAILGFAQLLEMEESHGEVNEVRVREILSNGGKLLKIADKMLDIARMDAGDLSIAEELVDWREVVIWCGDLIRPIAAEKSVEISYHLGGEGFPRIVANRKRLGEVLFILLSNAVKFNQRGGRVFVSAENLAASKALRISIADTGMGIPAAKMNLLFIPFERLGVEQTGIEGVGIGLALARRLVKAMHGTLHVESVEGRGSTFLGSILASSNKTVRPRSVTGACRRKPPGATRARDGAK